MTPASALRRSPMVLVIAAVAAAVASSAHAATGPEDSWEKYRLLADRNIFVRDRRVPRPVYHGPSEPAPTPHAGRHMVLTGTARQRDEFIAFFEDSRTGRTLWAQIGDSLLDGRIEAITLNGVEYESDGTTTTVKIGYSLSGEPAPPPPALTREVSTPPSQPEPDETQATAPAPGPEEGKPEASSPTPASALTEILERMRQRREQELKQ